MVLAVEMTEILLTDRSTRISIGLVVAMVVVTATVGSMSLAAYVARDAQMRRSRQLMLWTVIAVTVIVAGVGSMGIAYELVEHVGTSGIGEAMPSPSSSSRFIGHESYPARAAGVTTGAVVLIAEVVGVGWVFRRVGERSRAAT